MRKTILSVVLGAIVALPAAVTAAPAKSGFDHANANSALLRCGTREPNELEKMLREESFLKLRSQLNKGKPGGGGSGDARYTADSMDSRTAASPLHSPTRTFVTSPPGTWVT